MDQSKERLAYLEKQQEQLYCEGKYCEQLQVLEELLQIKMSLYGGISDEYIKQADKICELCNLIAMICLQQDNFDSCFQFLLRSEVLSQVSHNYQAITFNNMACYYRRIGKLRSALSYLQAALNIELKQDNPHSVADTHLNICAVLSQLGRHQEAFEHILLSITNLQEECFEIIFKRKYKIADDPPITNNNNDISSSQQQNNRCKNNSEDRLAVLAIAYHNMGVELEFLKRKDEAIQIYTKAIKFASDNLGQSHHLVKNLKQVLRNANEQFSQDKIKIAQKREFKETLEKNSISNFLTTKRASKIKGLQSKEHSFGQQQSLNFTNASTTNNQQFASFNNQSPSPPNLRIKQQTKQKQIKQAQQLQHQYNTMSDQQKRKQNGLPKLLNEQSNHQKLQSMDSPHKMGQSQGQIDIEQQFQKIKKIYNQNKRANSSIQNRHPGYNILQIQNQSFDVLNPMNKEDESDNKINKNIASNSLVNNSIEFIQGDLISKQQ